MSSSLNLDVTVLSQVLTVAQKLAIRNALLKIKLQENLSDIKFWGKIAGQTTNSSDAEARRGVAQAAVAEPDNARSAAGELPRWRSPMRCSAVCEADTGTAAVVVSCCPCAGLQQDYFIAVSTSLGSTITKNFYWRSE